MAYTTKTTYNLARSIEDYGLNKSIKDSNKNNYLSPSTYLTDNTFNSKGLYSREELYPNTGIGGARFNKYSRFGRILDIHGRLNGGREYLFFVKPDLHICCPDNNQNDSVYQISGSGGTIQEANNLKLNPQLDNNAYFMELIGSHPDVIKELQYSAGENDKHEPFGHLLSYSVSSNLQLDGSTLETMDNPNTIYGTSYKYLKDAESSDENVSFQLEFTDNKYLDTYHFFRAFSEYQIIRKSGLITPPSMDYYRYRRLHNEMGIYKFIVDEDMETLIYWAYFWGVIPLNCPREAFSDPSFGDGLTFSISFEAAFIEDMTPTILYQFNKMMKNGNLKNAGYDPNSTDWYDDYIPVYKEREGVQGRLPSGCLVDGRAMGTTPEARQKYRLRWYCEK